jgi:glycosyltransferase involved in cell wall biosynthesis
MHRDILPGVIFSPGDLALGLAEGLESAGTEVTLYTPGPVNTPARNVTADLRPFEAELAVRGDTYISLLRKHPMIFVSLARQAQAEVISAAFAAANENELDVVHIYANEEDIALPFARFCAKPVVFTHHDPFDFLVKYRRNFPKYRDLNWISLSLAQRRGMPEDTNWVANIYHGLEGDAFKPNFETGSDYLLYLGRIVEPKGVHLAIEAVKQYNLTAKEPLRLLIAGKHYAENAKDMYWTKHIEPAIDGREIEYLGHLRKTKPRLLAGARALLMPSTFDEPFGMSMIEALACGTPVIGLDSGAIPEVVKDGETGFVVSRTMDGKQVNTISTARALAGAIKRINEIDRRACRQDFEARFTLDRMVHEHRAAYDSLAVVPAS